MVQVTSIVINPLTKEATVELFADTKAEVNSADIVGLPQGVTIASGSSVMTADGDIAFRKSDNTWKWS